MKINNLSVHQRAIYRIIYANAIAIRGGLLTICQGQKSSKKGQLLPVDLARLHQGNNPSHSQNGSCGNLSPGLTYGGHQATVFPRSSRCGIER